MENINNILIVEDEENIALALESIIRRGINNSNIQIANDGQQAWEMLKEQAFDLILSDWNMPIKSGDELLLDVRQDERTRHIPFLMLTARADKDSIITAVQAGVNDYIAKPFEKSDIINKVRKYLAKTEDNDTPPKTGTVEETDDSDTPPQASVVEEIVEKIVQRLKNNTIQFPVMPTVGNKVKELLKSGDISVEELASVIKTDPTMTSKIISLSNSASYRSSQPSKTLEDAIIRIGLRQTESYVYTLSQRGLFQSKSTLLSGYMNRLWDHSLATGAAAHTIATHMKRPNPESYFTMGVLHDIGILLLLQLLQEIHDDDHLLEEATIEEVLIRLHTQFGTSLLKEWCFPAEFIDIAQYHHDVTNLADHTDAVALIAFADRLAKDIGYGMLPTNDEELNRHPAAHCLGLNQDTIDKVTKETQLYINEVTSAMA